MERHPIITHRKFEEPVWKKGMIWVSLLACLSVFVWIAGQIDGNGVTRLDRNVPDWLQSPSPLPEWMLVPGWLDHTYVMAASAILGAVVFALNRLWWPMVVTVLNVSATWLLSEGLKAWFARPRPATALETAVDGFGFPSGTAMVAVALYGFLGVWLLRSFRSGRHAALLNGFIVLILALLLCIALMSRVWSGVHYPSDVLAGALLGFALMLLWLVLSNRGRRR